MNYTTPSTFSTFTTHFRPLLALLLGGLLLCEFLLWTSYPQQVSAGASYALERTQQANKELLEDILKENEEINKHTDAVREFWIEDSPAQWEANIAVLEEMVEEVVEFAQSGFGGNPAFVTDVTRYLEDAEARATDNFIQNIGTVTELPYEGILRQVLGEIARNSGTVARFDDGFVNRGNLEAFFRGDRASTGGWSGFREMVHGKDALDAFFRLQLALEDVQRRTIENELTALNWSQGFLSAGQCQMVQGREVCEVSTPGAIIMNMLTTALGSGFDAAIAAQLEGQDLDAAIFDGLRQLSNDVLNEANGLLSGFDFLAAFNIDNLLRGLDLENILFDLIDILFGPDDEIIDEDGRIQQGILAEVRTSIDRVLDIQADAIAQLDRLAGILENRTPAEMEAIIIQVLGENYNTYLTRVNQSYEQFLTLSERLENISQEAVQTNTTEVDILRQIINQMSVVQDRLPSSDDVANWQRIIDGLAG